MNYGLVKNLVGGRFVDAVDGGVVDVLDPATGGDKIGEVPAMTAQDIDAVYEAAAQGAIAWKAIGHLERGRALLNASALIRESSNELIELIVREMGKTRAEATGEVGKSAEFFEYYGGLARLPFGQLLPDARPNTSSTQRQEPLGIVLLITPWNDPLLTPSRKLAPALLAGNAVIIKPSTDTPMIALKLAEILDRAGLVAGALSTVTGRGSVIGDALTAGKGLKAVSFTGSTSVGLDLQRKLAGTGVRVQTEMGGKNAAVVLDDADLELASPTIMAGAFAQAGQRCTATSRLIVQRGVAATLQERISAAVSELHIAGGSEEGVNMGPVVNPTAKADINDHVSRALQEGAEILATSPLTETQEAVGSYVAPSFLKVTRQQTIWREEVFGPVLSMIVVDTIEEAITAVNDSAYGLSSAIFTSSLASAQRFVDAVETGLVSVNLPTSGWDVHQPFGGFKDSGSPFKEQGLDALSFYTRVKTAAIRFA
jgi:acyl-CoA reductase-like NAD-dependent aldehyde dehydrogenase